MLGRPLGGQPAKPTFFDTNVSSQALCTPCLTEAQGAAGMQMHASAHALHLFIAVGSTVHTPGKYRMCWVVRHKEEMGEEKRLQPSTAGRIANCGCLAVASRHTDQRTARLRTMHQRILHLKIMCAHDTIVCPGWPGLFCCSHRYTPTCPDMATLAVRRRRCDQVRDPRAYNLQALQCRM